MQQYADKREFVGAIKKSAELYIREFEDIAESDRNRRFEGERTPYENIAYQLGWMGLLRTWEEREQSGFGPEMPAPGIKWNRLGPLHERFYQQYQGYSIKELTTEFNSQVDALCTWLQGFDEATLFEPGGRKWAQSSASNWPVWKWVHINTVAPFKSFRTKMRKWKKNRSSG